MKTRGLIRETAPPLAADSVACWERSCTFVFKTKKTPKSALLMLILAPQRKATVSMWTEAVQSVSLINLSAKNVITWALTKDRSTDRSSVGGRVWWGLLSRCFYRLKLAMWGCSAATHPNFFWRPPSGTHRKPQRLRTPSLSSYSVCSESITKQRANDIWSSFSGFNVFRGLVWIKATNETHLCLLSIDNVTVLCSGTYRKVSRSCGGCWWNWKKIQTLSKI